MRMTGKKVLTHMGSLALRNAARLENLAYGPIGQTVRV
jgi:hypothetical protein